MDVINDLNGSYVCTFVRRKLRMWAGQTDRAITVRDDRLEMIGQLIGEKLGHIGILDCDAVCYQTRLLCDRYQSSLWRRLSILSYRRCESSGSVDRVGKWPAARPSMVSR